MKNRKIRRKRGRPPSGKKAFCIRLTPKARAKLCQLADEHELDLGGWLECLAAVNEPLRTNQEGDHDAEEVRRRFEFVAREAYRFVGELNEMFDLDPLLAKTDSAKGAVQRFYTVAKSLCAFMASEGVVTRSQ